MSTNQPFTARRPVRLCAAVVLCATALTGLTACNNSSDESAPTGGASTSASPSTPSTSTPGISSTSPSETVTATSPGTGPTAPGTTAPGGGGATRPTRPAPAPNTTITSSQDYDPSFFKGLDCRSSALSVASRIVTWVPADDGPVSGRVAFGKLGFDPVVGAADGFWGDIASQSAGFLGTDAQGRLHAVVLRGPTHPSAPIDQVIGTGFGRITALAGAVLRPIGENPVIFTVTTDGRVLRYDLSGFTPGKPYTLPAPTQIASGFAGATGLAMGWTRASVTPQGQPVASPTEGIIVAQGTTLTQLKVSAAGAVVGRTSITFTAPGIPQIASLSAVTCSRNGSMVSRGGWQGLSRMGTATLFGGDFTLTDKLPPTTTVKGNGVNVRPGPVYGLS